MNSNKLIHESSPYLLQHANNPVDWYAWGREAFDKAKEADKPILVSIGYAACHWCHVMERESFEDETIAAFMNKHFVNIKVDREERPDVDHIYMNACQLLTGAGGWPLNMFLTPQLQPFTGGTYYPPKPAYGKPSWLEVLSYVHNIYSNERDKVEEQASLLSEHILRMDDAFILPPEKFLRQELIFSSEDLMNTIQQLKNQFDTEYGGFGNAPKFPGSMSLRFLLKSNYYLQDDTASTHFSHSLNSMMNGGIYDQIAGGFARYTVDRKWMIPHFEKMLYDNALLISLFSEGIMATGNEKWKQVVIDTLNFMEKEMMSEEGGFYSSYDADSEGVEGKYYTWTKEETDALFGDRSEFVCKLHSITEKGNWEHTNILHRSTTDEQLCLEFGLTAIELSALIKSVNSVLYKKRKTRIKPGLDDKIIFSWNTLMVSAYAHAYIALKDEHYKHIAEKCLQFLMRKLKDDSKPNSYFHSFRNGSAKHQAMLEDVAGLIQALLDVYEITGIAQYLNHAIEMTEFADLNFSAGVMYYFTHKDQSDIPFRNKDFYDNATPSGNSVMFQNMLRLSALTGEIRYHQKAGQMFEAIRTNAIKHGNSFGNWLSGGLSFIYPTAEIIVTGKNAEQIAAEISTYYYPNKTVQFDEKGNRTEPVFANRYIENETQIYICRGGECKLPVTSLQDFYLAMKSF